MAEGGHPECSTDQGTITETIQVEQTEAPVSPTLQLKLHPPKNDKKVKWSTETVDNEHMNKKKSKCCCIYEKPKLFGESSSEEEDDDDCTFSCRGHKKKCFRHDQDPDHNHDHSEDGPSSSGGGGGSEIPATT